MPRRILVALAALAALVVVAPPATAQTPPNPGDSKNCTDFPGWNESQVWFETYQPHYGDVANLDANGDGVPCESLPGAPTSSPPPAGEGGYWMVEANGTVFGFGSSRPLLPIIRQQVTAIAAAPNGGYWAVTPTGQVHSRGARHFGNANVTTDTVATIAGLGDGSGYWLFTRRGRVLPFGAAQSFGDMTGTPLNGEIVASAATPTGKGYWMVGSDGGIFAFGDAKFYGSTGSMRLNRPVVGIAPDPDGVGYWLVAADGGIFAFEAPFRGSVPGALGPGRSLNKPIIGALAYGNGYLMVASDGGIFAFSNRPFLGSLGNTPPPNPIVGVAIRGGTSNPPA